MGWLEQHLFDVAFDLANNDGRLIQRIVDTRESAQPGDDTFQRLMRKAQVSFDQLVEDADPYILTVRAVTPRLMNDPETPISEQATTARSPISLA